MCGFNIKCTVRLYPSAPQLTNESKRGDICFKSKGLGGGESFLWLSHGVRLLLKDWNQETVLNEPGINLFATYTMKMVTLWGVMGGSASEL
jgi:hypothetical protein